VFSSASEAVLLELVVELLNRLVVCAAGTGGGLLLLELEELVGVGDALLLEFLNEALLGPAHLGGEVTESAVLAVSLESEALKGVGHNDSLLVVIGEGNALEDSQAGKGSGAAGLLVGEHGAERSPEHAGGRLVVNKVLLRVGVTSLVDDLALVQPVSEEGTGDVDALATDDSDALTVEELLGDNAGQTTQHMTATINYNLLFEHA
jgi:hypothetical protein